MLSLFDVIGYSPERNDTLIGIEEKIPGTVVLLPGLTNAARIDQVHVFRLQGYGIRNYRGSEDLASLIADPEPLDVSVSEKANMNTPIALPQEVEDSLGLKHIDDVRLEILGCSMAKEISIPQHLDAGQALEIANVPRGQLLVAIAQSLVCQDIEAFGAGRLEYGQIMISQDGDSPFPLQELKTFAGTGIVSDQITEVDQILDIVFSCRFQNCFQGFQISVHIRDYPNAWHLVDFRFLLGGH